MASTAETIRRPKVIMACSACGSEDVRGAAPTSAIRSRALSLPATTGMRPS